MTKYEPVTVCNAFLDDVQAPQTDTLRLLPQTDKLTPFLKWAGGKVQELKYILPSIPAFDKYFEPFVGGGAVFFSVTAKEKYINDKSSELFNLYTMIASHDQHFFHTLDILLAKWQRISEIVDKEAFHLMKSYQAYSYDECSLEELTDKHLKFIIAYHPEFMSMFHEIFNKEHENFIWELKKNLLSKTKRMKMLENRKWKLPENDIVANIESALKSAFYMHLRYLYNKTHKYAIPANIASAIYFFVRENAYASMFRYNRQGEFNVPYGGISYNRKNLLRKINYMRSSELQEYFNNTVIENIDFEEFLRKYSPTANDFIFLDPPYDSEFSTYAKNEFSMADQRRLASYLREQCQAKFMLVIKNTPAIFDLYSGSAFSIRTFDKRYLVSFQDRNDREAEHLMITNY